MAIIKYILAHWIEWLFAGVTGAAAFGYRVVLKRLQEERERNEAVAEGVQSLLRESIVRNYNKYHDKGYCPIYAKQSIKNVYAAYHKLGGNDIATDLYHKILDLPTEEDEHNEQ